MFHLKRKGLFTASIIALMLLALVPTHWAKAADSTYTGTISTAIVGTAVAADFQYTKGDNQTWVDWVTGTNETLTVTLPAQYPVWSSLTYTVEWDTDVTNNATGETAIAVGTTIGTYSVSSRVMTIRWNTAWTSVAAVRVVVTAGLAPTYTGSVNVAFGGATAAGDTDPSGNVAITVSAADATADLALGNNSVVGVASSSTLTVNVPTTIPSGGVIVFTAPANLNVASAAYSYDSWGGKFVANTGCAASGQVITCTTNAEVSASSTGKIFISGIKSIYAKTSQTISSVSVKDAVAGNTCATDSSGVVTNSTTGNLTGGLVLPATNLRGNAGAMIIKFTTVTSVANLGKIVLTFPAMFSVSSLATTVATGLSGLDGTWTATVSGQTVTLTQTSGGSTAAGAKSLTISPITNSTAGADQILITTKTPDSEEIERVYSSALEVISASSGAVNPNTGPATTVVAPPTTTTPIVTTPVITPITPTQPPVVVTPAPAAQTTVTIQDLLSKKTFDVTQAKALVKSISADKNIVALTTGTPACTADTLVKGTSNKTVYYCGQNGKRFVFPNEKTYKTWFVDFSNVQTLSDSALSKISLGGNATYKPGVKLIKIQTDPKVYVVAPGGVLRWIGSEILAAKYYGINWNKQIDDVSDAFFTNYTIGTPITE